MPLPKVILFDADGTLYESEEINFRVNQQIALEMYDFDYTWDEFDKHVRRGTKDSHQVIEDAGVDVDIERFLDRKHDLYEEIVAEELQPMPGLIDFLEWCRGKKIRCIVVSSSRRHRIDSALKVLGIGDYFEAIISVEDVGTARKPDPKPYLMGLELAGAKPAQTLVIEDTDKGITSAHAAGMACIAIHNDSNAPEELTAADHVIHDFSEIPPYLTNKK